MGDFGARQRRAWLQALAARRRELTRLGDVLEALSYRGVLRRGYALVTDEGGRPIRSVREAPAGRRLAIHLGDGDITAVSGGNGAPRRKKKPGDDGTQGNLL